MSNKSDDSKDEGNLEYREDPFFVVDEYVEEVHEEGTTIKRRGVYLLPNLLTTGNLFCGFFAIILSQVNSFSKACLSIFIAMVLDGLDGRVARIINAQSRFGEQYDSMADMVTFGIAPAVIVYHWALSDLNNMGTGLAFVYVACVALRLARFNTQLANAESSQYFVGLASPSAAALIAGMVWALSDFGIGKETFFIVLIAAVVTIAVSVLMVSNIRYYSFKQWDLRGRVPFVSLLVIVLVFAVLFLDPPTVLVCAFLIYAFSGPVNAVLKIGRK